jgi:squalene synthase HpnC
MVSIESQRPLAYLDAPAAVLARARQENFPVASHLLPRDVRASLMAIYGFARLADDLGDEAPGDRLAGLEWLETELGRAADGSATHPVLVRLAPVMEGRGLSLDPFLALIEANRVDQRVNRYKTFADLVDYCMLSAAPVGRLVLEVFGASTPERVALSDRVCIGLQVVEHLQDVGEDARRSRVYLPLEDMARFGCREEELLGASASPALRGLVAMEVIRARGLLAAGLPLAATLGMGPRVAVTGFAAGGMAALDSIGRAGNDVLAVRCRPRKLGFARRAIWTLLSSSLKRGAW